MTSSSQKMRVRRLRRAKSLLMPLPASTPAAASALAQGSIAAKLHNKEYRRAYIKAHLSQGISHQIRTIRERRGLTQAEFAKRAKTTQTIVSRLEDPSYGRFTLNTLIRVAETFDVALLVKFVSFPKFLFETADKSPDGLYAASYGEVAEHPFFGTDNFFYTLFPLFVSDSAAFMPVQGLNWNMSINTVPPITIDVTPVRTTAKPEYTFTDLGKQIEKRDILDWSNTK